MCPIAIGEVLRRLVGKCIAKQTLPELTELFLLKQLGVRVKDGAEGIILSTKMTFKKLQLSQDAEFLQLSFKNAYNSTKTSQILKAAVTLIPSRASYAKFCNPQHIFTIAKSQSGGIQGDHLGPLLFSLTFWLIIEEIESKIRNLAQHCWYLDVGVIAGTETELSEALDFFYCFGQNFGLRNQWRQM